jgi:hypothetical protein
MNEIFMFKGMQFKRVPIPKDAMTHCSDCYFYEYTGCSVMGVKNWNALVPGMTCANAIMIKVPIGDILKKL